MRNIFHDAVPSEGQHLGFVEHDEIDLSDDEIQRLKMRARKAVTMDSATQVDRTPPPEYREFLGQTGGISHEEWLRGGR